MDELFTIFGKVFICVLCFVYLSKRTKYLIKWSTRITYASTFAPTRKGNLQPRSLHYSDDNFITRHHDLIVLTCTLDGTIIRDHEREKYQKAYELKKTKVTLM